MKSTRTTSQSGFTLIELVVVIVILGILAAVAVPRFVDLSDDARSASVAGVGGAFTSSVQMVRAAWLAGGNTGVVDNLSTFGDQTIDTNASGYPVATDNTNDAPSASDCAAIWSALLDNPPTAATSGTPDYDVTLSGTDCRYTLAANSGLWINYAADTGTVTIDSTP